MGRAPAHQLYGVDGAGDGWDEAAGGDVAAATPSNDLHGDDEQRDAALVMTKKAQEEGCLWFIWRLTLIFIVAPGITLAVVIPIAEYVEDKWGQCVNVRIASWMNSVTPAWRGREEWPVCEECKNAVMPWE